MVPVNGGRLPRRVIIMTPNVLGADGVSTLTRSVVRAFLPWNHAHGVLIEVWSLNERVEALAGRGEAGIEYRLAGGSKTRFSAWALQAAAGTVQGTLVVVMHLALAPVALPLVARNARMTLFLLGIEAWRKLGAFESAAVRRASPVMAISRHTIERFHEANPHLVNCEVAPCHLGTSENFQLTPAAQGGLPGPFALIVARMSAEERYKGHDLLLDIWPDVIRSVPDARLVIAGDGDDRGRLQQRAAQQQLNSSVTFTGRVADDVLARLYQDCSFYVMPSRNEGFGLVFLEAMQAGKACLGSTGAAAEIIENEVTGIVIDPDDRNALRGAVVRLFRNREEAVRMGQAGAARVGECFLERHFHERFHRLLAIAHPAADISTVDRSQDV